MVCDYFLTLKDEVVEFHDDSDADMYLNDPQIRYAWKTENVPSAQIFILFVGRLD